MPPGSDSMPKKTDVVVEEAAIDVKTAMRRFQLHRDHDESGVSGVGVVAEGCEFSNGLCSLTWLTEYRCVTIFTSVKELIAVHGHEGATRLVWVD